MTWQGETLNRITAKNASMKANGASIESREKTSRRRMDLLSLPHRTMDGERTTITLILEIAE